MFLKQHKSVRWDTSAGNEWFCWISGREWKWSQTCNLLHYFSVLSSTHLVKCSHLVDIFQSAWHFPHLLSSLENLSDVSINTDASACVTARIISRKSHDWCRSCFKLTNALNFVYKCICQCNPSAKKISALLRFIIKLSRNMEQPQGKRNFQLIGLFWSHMCFNFLILSYCSYQLTLIWILKLTLSLLFLLHLLFNNKSNKS